MVFFSKILISRGVVEENYDRIDNDMRDSHKSRKNDSYKPSRCNDKKARTDA